jgi:hypothetical protein
MTDFVVRKNGRASREKQVPRCARNDRQKSKGNSKGKGKSKGKSNRKKQIPKGNDRKKGKGNSNGDSSGNGNTLCHSPASLRMTDLQGRGG